MVHIKDNQYYIKIVEDMGYKKMPGKYRCRGQAIFTDGQYYISFDIDHHNGGIWKKATSPERLGKKKTRRGTYNETLKKRIGD